MSQITNFNTSLLNSIAQNITIINGNVTGPGGGGAPRPTNIPGNLTPPAVARTNGQIQVNQANIQNVAGHAVPGQEGCWAKIGRWLAEGVKRHGGLQGNVTVAMPDGGNVTFPRDSLAGMIKSLPRMDRMEARNNLATSLAGRLTQGKNLLDHIHAGNAPAQTTVQDVADLMLYMDASARVSGQGFSAGAFSIEDADGHIAAFLNRCPDKYQRSSSHLNDTQTTNVDGHLNTHRGIDIPQGPHGLPDDHATMLFGVIPARAGTPRRIFLKEESCGCRLNTLGADARTRGADQTPDRPKNRADISSMIGHGFSFLATRGQGSAAGSRKERIPSAIENAYKTLQKAVEHNAELSLVLARNHVFAKSAGVRTMLDNMREALDRLIGPAREAFQGQCEPIINAMSHLTEVNHLDVRIGNEVIRDVAEMLHPQLIPMTDQQKLTVINQALGL